MGRSLALAAVIAAGCSGTPGPTGPVAGGAAGLSLTYYVDRKPGSPEVEAERIVVVEQRRWVDIGAERTLEIDQIDEGADLESLVIESLSSPGGLVLGRCARDSVVAAARASTTSWIGRRAEITVDGGRTATGTITSIDGNSIVLVGEDGRTFAVTTASYRSIRVIGGDSMVRCDVDAGSGKQLVRVVYTTAALGFSAEHTMRVTLGDDGAGTAELQPRFTVQTPAWQLTAAVALFDGTPGGGRAPREVFRGPITLTGDPVVVSGPAQSVPARIDAVYRGAIVSPGEPAREQYWRNNSSLDVWDWLALELGEDTMPPGRIMLDITQAGEPVPQPLVIEADAIEAVDGDTGEVRIKLWPATELRGRRDKQPISAMNNELVETLHFAISNSGDRTREVVIEEELRPAKTRSVLRPWPRKPAVRTGVLRFRIKAPPGVAAHAGCVMQYKF